MPPRKGTVDLTAAITGAFAEDESPARISKPRPRGPEESLPREAAEGPVRITVEFVPDPEESSAEGDLSAADQGRLSKCELAIDNLRVAFAAAGKALQTIRDGRLYRETHKTFVSYVEEHWDIKESQAYRLIDAWPLAAKLSPMGEKINERQVRELLPLAKDHGEDAAVTVYQAVSETDGVTVTAAVLHGVVGALPAGEFDPAEAVRQIRAYLAGELTPPGRPPADPVRTLFTAGNAKWLKDIQEITASRDIIKAAREADPERVQQIAATFRAVADQLTAE